MVTNESIFDNSKLSLKDSTSTANESESCKKSINIIDSVNSVTEKEKEANYNYLECPFCDQKNYYLKKEKDKINALNIKCLYCYKYFFATICPKCKNFFKLSQIIHEGELIYCPNKDCNNQYIQTSCIKKDCKDVFNFTRHKIYQNLPTGVVYNHKSELVFQKISCYFCFRPIDYITKEETKINRYYEAQKVICPYKDCGKCFNRIICPKCTSVIIVELGMYLMGSKIKCMSCNYIFGKIYCFECKKLIPFQKGEIKYGDFECRYSNCSKVSHMANCLHCQKINYFKLEKDQNLIQGIPIRCAYEDCRKKFSCVYCPSCHGLNPFPKCDFVFGKLYKCINKANCSKSFIVIVCPKCKTFSRVIEDLEGKIYTCTKCNTLLSNFQCPYCNISILDINSNYRKGQVMKCPNCDNKFSFCRCYDCRKLIYYKESKTILGKSVKCQCGVISVNIICPLCTARISISDRDINVKKGETIHCPSCDKDFQYEITNYDNFDLNSEENIYYSNLSAVEILEGEKFNFGKGEVDENFLEKQKMFVNILGNNISISQNETMDSTIKKDDISKIEEKIKNNLCIICQCYEKESIFFPCAHRCTCYKCAVYYFEVFKKCPKCGEKAQAIIPKIYNT